MRGRSRLSEIIEFVEKLGPDAAARKSRIRALSDDELRRYAVVLSNPTVVHNVEALEDLLAECRRRGLSSIATH